MKKKEFEGIDLAVVQKFKAPIEKFNSNIDLQNWAKEKAEAITEKTLTDGVKKLKSNEKQY